ncbi:hypothetical protein GCM10009087_38640 [Sphingomonas oligophenolica]|uniref:Uncharacterized protein n=1 Tax=Sphingomonas oligophenolica TaxID=301154 RepID=A0ABU9Y4S7_9SPHN
MGNILIAATLSLLPVLAAQPVPHNGLEGGDLNRFQEMPGRWASYLLTAPDETCLIQTSSGRPVCHTRAEWEKVAAKLAAGQAQSRKP